MLLEVNEHIGHLLFEVPRKLPVCMAKVKYNINAHLLPKTHTLKGHPHCSFLAVDPEHVCVPL